MMKGAMMVMVAAMVVVDMESQGVHGASFFIRVPGVMLTGSVADTTLVSSRIQCAMLCSEVSCRAFTLLNTNARKECTPYHTITRADSVVEEAYETFAEEHSEKTLRDMAYPITTQPTTIQPTTTQPTTA
ncbi:uncharacterized protein LOC121867894 [Homarus americanus]|uniref:Putative PAN domain-containing protein 4 n=1 Tax=Homarus americanus TaxID=6706 RepID=A0A8J5K680_HOMAM|nr:uncharacterized protein LOC121867894 [Homarus americanus]KAG7167800.1 putative PAN domain-containing protein 4 [Homarus americanus]